MDKWIAFAAGAVVAFGLGYYVSSRMNAGDSGLVEDELGGVAVTAEDLAIEPPGPSAAANDEASEADRALTEVLQGADAPGDDELSTGEIGELKKLVLPLLSAAEIATWRAAREERVKQLLTEGDMYWQVGEDGAASARFDAELAARAVGDWSGTLRLQPPGATDERVVQLRLTINGFDDAAAANRLSIMDQAGKPMLQKDFRRQIVGTDTDAAALIVVWPAPVTTEGDVALPLALKLAVATESGQAASGEVRGLSPELRWVKVGSYELKRAK